MISVSELEAYSTIISAFRAQGELSRYVLLVLHVASDLSWSWSLLLIYQGYMYLQYNPNKTHFLSGSSHCLSVFVCVSRVMLMTICYVKLQSSESTKTQLIEMV